MPTTYGGNPANYPTSITIPSDGDGPGIRAADVNSGFEGLADRTAQISARVDVHDDSYDWARPLRALPAVSFGRQETATNPYAMRYVPGMREWLVWHYSSSNALYKVADIFDTWPSTDLLTDATFNGLPTVSADGDSAGNRVVLFGDLDRSSEFNGTAWSNVTTVLAADFTRPCVAWEPVSNTWIAVAGDPTIQAAATSVNRTVWTPRTNPFPVNTECTLEVDRAGVVVMAGYNGSTLYLSRSTNGGVTWSAAVSIAVGFTMQREGQLWPRPVWSGSRWFVLATGITSTDVKIYTSTNGVAWTVQSTLTGWGFVAFGAIGDVLLGSAITVTGQAPTIVVSSDRGLTWRKHDRQFTSCHGAIFSNGSRFILGGTSRVWPSSAVNDGVEIIT